ncbi:mitochondrial respiratory chain complex I protein [Malassezia pachydermatis]
MTPAMRAASRMQTRAMSMSAVRMQKKTQAQLPKGTIVPGSKVDPQLGDYPAMPMENQQFRPYSRHWWDTQDRRQYGETLHEQDDVLNMWSPDAYKTPGPLALRHFLTAVGLIAAFSYVVYSTVPEAPMMRKTFPRNGLADELGGPQAAARSEQDE